LCDDDRLIDSLFSLLLSVANWLTDFGFLDPPLLLVVVLHAEALHIRFPRQAGANVP